MKEAMTTPTTELSAAALQALEEVATADMKHSGPRCSITGNPCCTDTWIGNDYPDCHCGRLLRDLAARDKWKEVLINELIVDHIYTKEHETDPRKALTDAIEWNCKVALDPAVSSDARALVANELRAVERYKGLVETLRALIADDAYCSNFSTVAELRQALLGWIDTSLESNEEGNEKPS